MHLSAMRMRRNRGAGPVIERLGHSSDAAVRRSIPRRIEPVCKKELRATLTTWMPSRRSCCRVIAKWPLKWPRTANAPSMRSTPSSASTSSTTMYRFVFPSSPSGGGKSVGSFWRRRSRGSNASSTRSSPMFRTPICSMPPPSCGQRGASPPEPEFACLSIPSGTVRVCGWRSSAKRRRPRASFGTEQRRSWRGRDGKNDVTPGLRRHGSMELAEWLQQLRPGENGQRRSEGQEDPVGNLLLPADPFGRDERDADDRADEVGREESQQYVAHAEPAESEAENQGEADVAETEQPRAHGVQSEEEDEPAQGAQGRH